MQSGKPIVRRFVQPKKEDKSLTQQQKKAVRKVARKVLKSNVEYKQYGVAVGATSVYDGVAGMFTTKMTNMSQGLLDNNRVGDEINIKSIHVRGLLTAPYGATTNSSVTFRLFVVQYKQNEAIQAPTIGDMLLQSNANEGADYGTFSSRNIDQLGVYHVLYDRLHTLVTGNANANNYGQPNSEKHFQFKVPMKYLKRKIQFIAAGNNATNGIWFIATTNRTTKAGGNPQITVNWDISFTDA